MTAPTGPSEVGYVETAGFAEALARDVGPVETPSPIPALASAIETVMAPRRRDADRPSPLVDHRGEELTASCAFRALGSGDALLDQLGLRPTGDQLVAAIGEVERRVTARVEAGEPGATPPRSDVAVRLEPETSDSDAWPPRGQDVEVRPRRGWWRE